LQHRTGMNAKWWGTAILALVGACQDQRGEIDLSATGTRTEEAPITSCSLTQPAVVAAGLRRPDTASIEKLKVDDRFVYFLRTSTTSPVSYTLERIDKNGGAPQVIVSDSRISNPDYAITATQIVFQEGERTDLRDTGQLLVWDKELRPLPVLEQPIIGCAIKRMSRRITASENGDLYWAQENTRLTGSSCNGRDIKFIAHLAPGASTPVVASIWLGTIGPLFADAVGDLYGDALGVEVDTGATNAEVSVVHELAGDVNQIYFTGEVDERGEGLTLSERRGVGFGGALPILDNRIFGLTIKDGFLYGALLRDATDGPNGNIIRVKPNGHGLTFLGRGNIAFNGTPTAAGSTASSVAVDDTFVYFMDATSDNLLKTCR
jgi:hypothetical protein